MPKSHSINQKGEKALTDQENKMSKFRSGIEIDDAESMEEDIADDNSQDEEIVRMDTETAIENGQNDHYIKEIDIILKSMVIGKAFGKANNSKRTSFMMKNVGSAKDSLIIQNCQVWSNDFKDHTKFNYGKTIDVGCQFHFKAETVSIVGDGNCMFNAISTALYGHMHNQADLRKILIIGLEKILNRLMIGNGFSPQDDWVILSVPGNGVTYVDNLTQHIDYIKMDTAWGTDFDVAVLGNVLKKRFGIFYPSLNGKSYNFSMILPGSQSQTWPLVFLHNTNLNHFDLIQNLATPNQPFEVQDEEELMEIDSDKNMSFVEENPIPLTIASIPMSEKNRNFLAEKGKNGPKVRRQRRELNDISPVKQIASSRAQRAAARSLVCQSKIGPAITKSNIKKSVEPQIAKTVTKCCARNPNKIPLQHTLGKLNVKCKCKAVFFEKEKTFKQCCNGHLTFKEFDNFPAELQELWTAISDDSNYFRNNSRFFNSKFCFASLNSEQRVLEGRGPPVYVIHGPVYRLFNTSMPESTQEATFAQMYLYGPERGGDLRVDGLNESRDRKLIRKLSEIIGDCNVFAKSYKTFHDFMVAERDRAILEDVLLPVYQLRLIGPQSDDRVRNLPVDNEVAAIYYGNPTYDPNTLFNLKRISRITYYQNLIAYRPQVFNPLHYAGLLFQQFLVDVFTTVETDRLNYIRQLNAEQRKTFIAAMEDYLAGDESEGQGTEFVKLYSSYVGGRRYMNLNYQDCMAIVLKFGKPTFFITMTCNPNWPEIKDNLLLGQKASDRPDLIARVFKHKVDALIKDLKSGIFGECVYISYNIEFQKRGLPHVHILIKIGSKHFHLNPKDVDECISAELPPLADNKLRELVLTHMLHNRCDKISDKKKAQCWDHKENKCLKKFPFAFQETTSITTSGKVSYKRSQNVDNNAFDSKGNVITNESVVPYSPFLLRKYNCHLNVVAVGSVSSVKYVFKYAHKGAPKIQIEVAGGTKGNKDEVNEFLEARYLGASEAIWRIMEYQMLYKDVTVYRLPVHLPTQSFAVADIESNFTEWSKQGRQNVKSQLDAFYELCSVDEEARSLTYSECPRFYSFDKKQRNWKKRVLGRKVIGRIFMVSAFEVEKFSLRQLLLHVAGPQSAKYLRTVNNVVYKTFFEAACELGLVNKEENFREILKEVAETSFPRAIRNFFALLICFYPDFEEHKELFEEYVDKLSEDYQLKYNNRDKSIQQALYDIRSALDDNNFRGPTNLDQVNIELVDLNFVENPEQLLKVGEEMYNKANPKQKEFIDKVVASVKKKLNQRTYFLQGPAGCGKTFVYMTLYYLLRGEGKIVINAASTGIAANLLISGQTCHSMFAIPFDILDDNVSLSRINQEKMKKLLEADVVIIDEAPMLNKWILGYIDRRLKEICENNLPFGGKVVILGGDFRQTLPIINNATRCENVRATIKCSNMWRAHFELFKLDQNMRVNQDEEEFAKWVLNVGDGNEKYITNNKISIPQIIRSSGDLIKEVFEGQDQDSTDKWTSVILASTNKTVDTINETVLDKVIPGEVVHLLSADLLLSNPSVAEDIQNLPIEYLNSLAPSGMPVHDLRLKLNCIVMVLRNLNIKNGICNGTRLIVKGINSKFITCEHILNPRIGETVFIPRIILMSPEKEFPFTFSRKQFPVRLAYAMTINKSQGQTLSRVGLDLTRNCFSHGQLYVGLSRIKSPKNLFVSTPNEKEIQTNITDNIVYKEVL
uniref:ATP-dependent DNA helicase n=1 Tax=Rhabditophanes sp. KR3021 TaxID=114890 RepID=A0AC35THX5_9BILA